MNKEYGRHVNALIKGLEILDCFAEHAELTIRQISEITKMNKSRIMRFCGTLQAKGYLLYEPEERKFSLGPWVLNLGETYKRNCKLVSLARPILRELAKCTSETAVLSVVENFQRLCLAREVGRHRLQYSVMEGEFMPLHAGASSKVLLAFSSEDFRGQFFEKANFNKLTSATITDLKEFCRELETVRRNGYAMSMGERDRDVGSLAVPVYSRGNKLIGAIAIAGPITRFNFKSGAKYLETLTAAAQKFSNQLGHTP